MKTRHWFLLFVISLPIFGLALCSAPSWQLENICEEKARITVIEKDAWAAFISKVRSQDLADQRAMIEARRTGAVVQPPETELFIRPFPFVEGYDYVPDAGHGHFFGERQPDRTPQPHNLNIIIDGRKIGILHDFEVKIEGLDHSPILRCSFDFPEVFDVRRTNVLK